ncbi:MAG: AMP-binding protein, partial [Proteobacteria bacterium]|nr:AMP-binding protein [Pseudomonadota bacterium]
VGARGEGKWKRITWEEALTEVAAKLDAALKEDPNTIMLKYGRNRTGGTIDRFMKTLGSATVLNHTSVCESSKKVGQEPTWGPDIETPDFANAKYVLNFGSNILEAAYFHNPLSQRIAEGRVDNHMKIVTFDVRLSNTAGFSDEWIPVFPATDGAVALAIGHVILREDLQDSAFIDTWTNVTVDELKAHYAQYTPEWASKISGVPVQTIERIAREFATTKPATLFTYRGPAKHLYGSYNEKACMMLPIMTGNVEKRGGYCLPRGMGWPQPNPQPPGPKHDSVLAHPPEFKLMPDIVQQAQDNAKKYGTGFEIVHDMDEAFKDADIVYPKSWGPLMTTTGKEEGKDGNLLRHLVEEEGITCFQATASNFRLLLDAGWKGSKIRKALCGGEPFPIDIARRLLPIVDEVWNMYGPTETTVWSTIHRVRKADGMIPIGKPIANTAVYILDEQLRPVLPGEKGEIYIGGSGLALGYLGRTDLTAERFQLIPSLSALAYKTGDLGRFLWNGDLEIFGRADHQVKLRGYRLELGEVEAVISSLPGIEQCLTAVKEFGPEDPRLIAYVTTTTTFDERQIRQLAKDKLPNYMLPAHYVVLAKMPLLPNGKTDRKQLPHPLEMRDAVKAQTSEPTATTAP